MTSEQAENLYQMICKAYRNKDYPLNEEHDKVIMTALATGQFVIKIKKGEVEWFAAYWQLTAENAERVRQRIEPTSVLHGEHIYIAEAVNNGSMKEMVAALRKKAGSRWANWHRPLRKDKFNEYSRG